MFPPKKGAMMSTDFHLPTDSGREKGTKGEKIIEENGMEVERKRWAELFHFLSHPFPTLMIDRVEETERDKRIRSQKWVTANEFYLAGHFPGEPILPGVLTLEGLVQSALLLVTASFPRGRLCCTLEKVDRVRFKRAIIPGDRVDFTVQLLSKEGESWKFKGQAQVEGETAAEANLALKVLFREVGFDL